MQSIEFYREQFVAYLKDNTESREPENLYEPMTYILNIGGKRLRPVLVLMTAELFGESYKKALDAALAIEIFHNFSLVHDDIMDDAPLRRGRTTVHEKWDENTAILSGDAMLINAYQLFENYELQTFKDLAKLFTRTAIKVCEGQQFDVDYEERDDVSLAEYIKMIGHKTAVLLGAAMEMGAIVAGVSKDTKKQVYEYGRHLGLAFQLQDDYLDVFGDPQTFGKQVGGDIVENKKTFLYLKALDVVSPEDKKQLQHLYTLTPGEASQKVETVTAIFKNNEVEEATQNEIKDYTNQAFNILEDLRLGEDKKEVLREFGRYLMDRKV